MTPEHRQSEQRGRPHGERSQNISAVHQPVHVPRNRDNLQRYEQAHAEPDAVEDSLDQRARQGNGKRQLGPARNQITPDHLARVKRQHFIREDSYVNGANALPEGYGLHGMQQQVPAPSLPSVSGEPGDHRHRDPPPVHRGEVLRQSRQLHVAQRPHQEADRNEIRQDKENARACPACLCFTQVTMITWPILRSLVSGL